MTVAPSCDTALVHWQLNGQLHKMLPIQDRGLAYGDGLFETCLLQRSAHGLSIPCWDYHKARALLGAKRLGLPLTEEALEKDFQHFLGTLPTRATGIIKLIVTRGQGGRGYMPSAMPNLNIIWQLLPAPKSGDELLGVALTVSPIHLAQQPVLAGLKHLNRLEYVLAAQACTKGIPLLLDAHHNIIETLSHNIFCVIDGQLVTPKLDHCGVTGVLRTLIVQVLAPELSLSVKEQVLSLEQLALASEVFMGNSIRGIWPVNTVSLLDGGTLKWPVGLVGCQLQQAWQRYLSLY